VLRVVVVEAPLYLQHSVFTSKAKMSDDGSEDSAPRPKRKIKRVVIVSSSSGSDSDENVPVAGTRRKRMRVNIIRGSTPTWLEDGF
jgi:hypothetical protein